MRALAAAAAVCFLAAAAALATYAASLIGMTADTLDLISRSS
ncbi:hypothetical protein [Arthrobacter silvisoli]|nr:hypothetical protein [Arthrobacter silvisoli]